MPMSVTFIPEEDRLDLSFDGNLDLTMSEDLCVLSSNIPPSLRTCVLDLTRVDRVFDSGLALLQLLCTGLRRVGATLVVLGDHPEINPRKLHGGIAGRTLRQEHGERLLAGRLIAVLLGEKEHTQRGFIRRRCSLMVPDKEHGATGPGGGDGRDFHARTSGEQSDEPFERIIGCQRREAVAFGGSQNAPNLSILRGERAASRRKKQ